MIFQTQWGGALYVKPDFQVSSRWSLYCTEQWRIYVISIKKNLNFKTIMGIGKLPLFDLSVKLHPYRPIRKKNKFGG
jgi:hypothetical protein